MTKGRRPPEVVGLSDAAGRKGWEARWPATVQVGGWRERGPVTGCSCTSSAGRGEGISGRARVRSRACGRPNRRRSRGRPAVPGVPPGPRSPQGTGTTGRTARPDSESWRRCGTGTWRGRISGAAALWRLRVPGGGGRASGFAPWRCRVPSPRRRRSTWSRWRRGRRRLWVFRGRLLSGRLPHGRVFRGRCRLPPPRRHHLFHE